MSLLCQGDTSMSIARFFEGLSSEFPILVETSDPIIKKKCPKKSYINSLRDCLPAIANRQLGDFLNIHATDEKKLIITIDQTTISKNCSIMGMGIVNSEGDHHSIGLVESSASKALEISNDMKNIIQKT